MEQNYEDIKEVAKDVTLRAAVLVFLSCLTRDAKPTPDTTSITLEMTDFNIEVKLKSQTEGKQNRITLPLSNNE